jgi:hypothetical protein
MKEARGLSRTRARASRERTQLKLQNRRTLSRRGQCLLEHRRVADDIDILIDLAVVLPERVEVSVRLQAGWVSEDYD